MPLVGALDSARLQLVQAQALSGIEAQGARHLLLDVTGVPVIDMLGAEVVLVGIRPEVAQSLVGLGVILDGIITRSTLQSGVAHVLGRGEGASGRTR
jgi:rsbT co-antagonist protein RsbR